MVTDTTGLFVNPPRFIGVTKRIGVAWLVDDGEAFVVDFALTNLKLVSHV